MSIFAFALLSLALDKPNITPDGILDQASSSDFDREFVYLSKENHDRVTGIMYVNKKALNGVGSIVCTMEFGKQVDEAPNVGGYKSVAKPSFVKGNQDITAYIYNWSQGKGAILETKDFGNGIILTGPDYSGYFFDDKTIRSWMQNRYDTVDCSKK